MSGEQQRVGILGGGSWATALVKILTTNLSQVHWWMRDEAQLNHVARFGHNPKYLQSVEFDKGKLLLTSSMQEVIDHCDVIVFAIPSAFLDKLIQEHKPQGLENKIIFSAIKGMVNEYHSIPARYFHKEFRTPYSQIGLICGPCHAEEVAQEKLSYLTSACPDESTAQIMADLLRTRYIKTFTSEDVFGTEIAAVLKNIYALASGICTGLGYGDNFQAVLVTGAISEMKLFVDTVHEIPRNVMTSPYLGDLLVTAYSRHSRNRRFGLMIAQGLSANATILESNMVAEGYNASKGIHEMNKRFKVDMPIADAVYQILYENKAPGPVIGDLTERLR